MTRVGEKGSTPMPKATLIWNGHAAKRPDGSREEYVDHMLDDARRLIARIPADVLAANEAVELSTTAVRSPATDGSRIAVATYRIEAHGNVKKARVSLRPFWQRCGARKPADLAISVLEATTPPEATQLGDRNWRLLKDSEMLDLRVEDQDVAADEHGAVVGRKAKHTRSAAYVCIHRARPASPA